ncbi:MAG: HlyD family efflux transporter periplasmic adaptor subunit, partial [Myxococcota bacterium]
MSAKTARRWTKYALAAAVVAVAVVVFLIMRGGGVQLGTAAVSRGTLKVSVEGSGKVRVRDRYIVTAPVSGHLLRIAMKAGDPVTAGQTVAQIAAATPFPLDARSRAEAQARLSAAITAQSETMAGVERARLAHDFAERQLARSEKLSENKAVTPQALDSSRFEHESQEKAMEAASLAVSAAKSNVEAARAVLGRFDGSRGSKGSGTIPLRAPAAGRILRVYQEYEGPVQAGTPVIEIGDPSALEAVVDLLTADAVRVKPGMTAVLEQWGGTGAIAGRVRLVEPSAFTRLSALGVEEQRVNVIIDPAGDGWKPLSDGYRVEARISVLERPGVMKVPASSIFRSGEGWAAFAVENGRAVKKSVGIGERGQREAEVLSGLKEGEMVILYP